MVSTVYSTVYSTLPGYMFPQKSELPPPGGGLLNFAWVCSPSPGTPSLRRPLRQVVIYIVVWEGEGGRGKGSLESHLGVLIFSLDV